MVVCCTSQAVIYIRNFPECYPSPSPLPPDRPQCVMFPSQCPYVFIVQLPLMSENMQCLVFCSCVSLLRMMSFIHVLGKNMNSFFLWLHSIPWCICATIFLIWSDIDGHLGWFQVFAIVNSTVINPQLHVSFLQNDLFSLCIYPVMGLIGHMTVLF